MNEDIDKKFAYIIDKMRMLEQHVINLIIPIQQITSGTAYENLRKIMNEPLKIDDRGIRRIVSDFAGEFVKFTHHMENINLKELSEAIKSTNMGELNSMMKYQANRLKGIEERLARIEKNEPERKVRVEVFVEGENKEGESKELKIDRALDCLDEKEVRIFKYRTKWILGAYTYKEIGKKVNATAERTSLRYRKILRKLTKEKRIEALREVMPEKSFIIFRDHLGSSYLSAIA